MNPNESQSLTLVRSAALLQVKLLLDAARDIALSPLTLAAVALDLVLLQQQPPRYFRAAVRFGGRTDRWIDVWSAGRDENPRSHMNVDALLDHVEDIVRDPQTGARRARVLKRWVTRQAARARASTGAKPAAQASGSPPPPPTNP